MQRCVGHDYIVGKMETTFVVSAFYPNVCHNADNCIHVQKVKYLHYTMTIVVLQTANADLHSWYYILCLAVLISNISAG